MNTALFISALLMGLTGSLHCAGMCGPLLWLMPFQHVKGRTWPALLLYHTGRISSYALLAFVLYFFKSLFHPQIQQTVSLVLGALCIVAGLLAFFPLQGWELKLPWTAAVKATLARVAGQPSYAALTAAGMLNGLLPCGLVYMALSLALSADTLPAAIGLMYTFGAGTLPMLISISVFKSRIGNRLLPWRKWVPVAMLLIGSLMFLRGMNLGIPLLSPRMEMHAGHVESSCCKKH